MAIVDIPLLAQPKGRTATSTKDFRMRNAFIDVKGEEDQDAYVLKRFGMTEQNDYSEAGQGRGIISWEGHIWAVFGANVYKDGVVLTTRTLGSTTGKIYWAPTGNTKLILQDPTQGDIYVISESDTALVAPEADADIPDPQVPGVVQLDTFTFVGDSTNTRIYNSEAADPTDWVSTSFTTPEIKSDPLVVLGRHINYIIAVGTDTIEFFRDAGNTTGSVLNRVEGYVTLYGAPVGSCDTFQNVDSEVYFVGESENGGRFVAKFMSLTPETVSVDWVEDILTAEGSNISNAFAWTIRYSGHKFYCLTLPTTADTTLVYDINEGKWSEWTSVVTSTEGYFDIAQACEHNGAQLLQGHTTGKVYTLSGTTYQDDSEDIYVEVQTDQTDNNTMANKFVSRTTVIGDQEGSSPTPTLTIQWADDDYQTYSTARTVDLSKEEPMLTRCGHYKKRAWRIQHRANTPMRLLALRMNVEQGHHGA